MSNTVLTEDELAVMEEEMYRQVWKDEMKREMTEAEQCPHFKHRNWYECDGCQIIDACFCIPVWN